MGHLPETDPAESEIPIECTPSAAIPTAVAETGRKFLALAHLRNSCNSCHKFSLGRRGVSGRRRRLLRGIRIVQLKRHSEER